ncbi:MAG: DUF1553 domain-containing protein [Bacteroidota bacterium]
MKKTITISIIFSAIMIFVIIQSCSEKTTALNIVDGRTLPAKIDYNFHVKPILSDRCFACHGPDEAKRGADLRLDTKEGMFAELASGGHAIIKGKPHRSKIIERIHHNDLEMKMPPPESNLNLTEYEKAVLEKWIEQGAEYKEHWSFIPPEKVVLPPVEKTDWAANEIDYFILSKIEKEHLIPSELANKETLIRRATFDLTGLPPTLEEVDNFLNDDSENAFEKVVDRLLASEKYGERMAADWLAVSRYGDTHGYEADSKRTAWQWRDWVINAFNENKPYDEFITEQLAGDLMPNAAREQIIATSFNRNHIMNSENGIIDEEWRIEYVSDRTNTLGKAIMGLTLECAKCHDHKYDPISQKDYFSLFAFFNNVDEPGAIRYETQAAPVLDLTTDEQQNTLEELAEISDRQRGAIAAYIQKIKASDNWQSSFDKNNIDLKKDLELYVTFEKTNKNKEGKIFVNQADPKRPVSFTGDEKYVDGPVGRALEYDGINETIVKNAGSSFASNEAYSTALWVRFPEPFSHARIFATEDGSFSKVPGYYCFIEDDKLVFQLCSTWDYNNIKVVTKKPFPFGKWTHLAVTYDGSQKAEGVKIFIDGQLAAVHVRKDNLTKNLNIMAWFKMGHSTFQGGAIDEFRQYSRVLTLPEIQTLAQKNISEEGWFDYYLFNADKKLVELRDSLKYTLDRQIKLLDTVPQLMVMGDLKDSIRPTYVLNRGVYDDHGEAVFANTPESVLSYPPSFPKNRLGLAEWLFMPENPLTSRVMINRMWQMIFGKGLVSTPDDFGSQGALPTHPALLDWLAVDFQENNWDMKKMIKKMVMSATYRQSSSVAPELLERDPNNDLLARGVRYRMPAEMVRDNALAVSGLLVDKIGGVPVKPYQPAGIWAQVSTARTPYDQDHGEKLYRRSLYTYWKRAVPPPNMLTFDAPSRHTCTVKREATSTPLQALVLLNDVQFVEAARVFAQNILSEEINAEKNIERAFRMATARQPKAEELNILIKVLQESKAEFLKEPAAANNLLKLGEYPLENDLDKVELAAFTMVTTAILNMNETITKG